MNCIEIISRFLNSLQIDTEKYSDLLRRLIQSSRDDAADVSEEVGIKAIHCILIDTYALNSQNVKDCAEKIGKQYRQIGRREKWLIKHYLDYGEQSTLAELKKALECSDSIFDGIVGIIDGARRDLSGKARDCFTKNWRAAEADGDSTKLFDYLQGLCSRLLTMLNDDGMTLGDIYRYNLRFIEAELGVPERARLSRICSDEGKLPAKKARRKFCDAYGDILLESLQAASRRNELEDCMNIASCTKTPFERYEAESYKLVYINIDQALFDVSDGREDFFDRVLSLLYYSYRTLDNHRTLAVNIGNIFDTAGQNLKWLLYAYIGIYAEHFIPTLEKRNFYKPEELCYDRCKYLGVELNVEQRDRIRSYFRGKIGFSELREGLCVSETQLREILLDFENIWYGYTFADCFIVESGSYLQNSEISFIENTNQILLIFNKYRHDDRKIPCPECAGLEISGNSFPELGLRSWECKNPLCPARSKSNRGKRYSKKSNFMQHGFDDGLEGNIISREMIKQWRRDVVKVASQDDLHQMLVKYFSFSGERALFINSATPRESVLFGRTVEFVDIAELTRMQVRTGEFESYFSGGGYVARYLEKSSQNKTEDDGSLDLAIRKNCGAMIAHGNSRDVLAKISDGTFTAAVTSPPYYNAREYSQWNNLYLYLSDMYGIIKEVYRTMKPGGVYLYNIGDICGNENTAVRSNMGNKKIILGAYTVHLFTAAGFELLDNIIWDKGEPQSNRQMNDGKYTPFYQKPMNVYEHMFIFKKPGRAAIVRKNINDAIPDGWKKNSVKLNPVFKINCNGENTLGHTAPFPLDIPNFVARVFTESEEDIILEPFSGSGTSMIAASAANVRSLGIELSREYVELAIKLGRENGVEIREI